MQRQTQFTSFLMNTIIYLSYKYRNDHILTRTFKSISEVQIYIKYKMFAALG